MSRLHLQSDPLKGKAVWRLVLAVLMVAGAGLSTLRAQKTSYTDIEVKAAMTMKIVSLVTWPEGTLGDATDPIVVGIIGEDPFGSHMRLFADEIRPLGRDVLIRRFPSYSASVDSCHLVFVSQSVSHDPDVLAGLRGKPILVLADDERLWKQGVHVNFGVGRSGSGANQVYFQANYKAAKASRVVLSSQLIQLSKNKGVGP